MKKFKWIFVAIAIIGATAYAAKVDSTMLVYLENAALDVLWSGDKVTVANGGEIEIRSGGTLDVQSGATFTQAGTITQTGAVNQSSKLDILSGGELEISSGATLDIVAGATMTSAATNTVTGAVNQDSKLDILSSGEVEISSGATFEFVSGGTWTVADGTIPRADLTEDALAVYDVANDLVVSIGYMTSALSPLVDYQDVAGISLKGTDAQSATINTDNVVDFRLPPEYVAGGDIKFSCYAKYDGTGTVGATKTIDVVAKKVTVATGAYGADICATAPITLTNTYTLSEFTITATGLVAGDVIQINLTTALQETGGVNPIAAYVINPHIQLDIKG